MIITQKGKSHEQVKGFSFIVPLLVIVLAGIIGFAGWYVWHSEQRTTASSASATRQVYLPYSGMKFSYDTKDWKVVSDSYVGSPCGRMEYAGLTYQPNTSFYLNFNFGACGKGGGICFDVPNSGCIAESQQLAKVILSSSKTAYVLASRTTIDNGNTWDYALWLTDSANCGDEICSFTTTGFNSNLGTIVGTFTSASGLSKRPRSLTEFAQLPEVTAATSLLKSVHY